jgi:hypothetical protein
MSLILVANNFTLDPEGKRILERPDGSADYRVGVYINHRPLFEGVINSHCRQLGAAELLRSIANVLQPVRKPVRGVNDRGRSAQNVAAKK